MSPAAALDRGREAFRQRAWGEAFAQLSEADGRTPLEPTDLEQLATAAYLTGRDEASTGFLTRAFHMLEERGDEERAARCAFWVAFGLMHRGAHAPAAGWFGRARRLLDDGRRDCATRGYLLLPDALQKTAAGDEQGARALFAEAAEIGERFDDLDLATLARHGVGRALIRLGDVARGVALLDEIMIGVTGGEVSPLVAGTVYCSVISACHDMFDLRRAREWTAALSRWCETQPDLVPYRGQCLVRRSEILQMRGAWEDAMNEARRVRDRLAEPPGQESIGAACYQQAELHRLRGAYSEAERAYREAHRHGRKPQPGLALLRLGQGRVDDAWASIRRVLDESRDRRTRAVTLPAFVEIALAAGDVPAARAAADELSAIASEFGTPYLEAVAAQAGGAVLVAEARPEPALARLRRALAAWAELEAPYESACVRVLAGLACRDLGDADTAVLEFDAARETFERLGAAPARARLVAVTGAPPRPAGGLTSREVEVLRLVASGTTNRAVADALGISEKTVARHLSNIFTKLDLSSRAAATAYAYRQGLVEDGRT